MNLREGSQVKWKWGNGYGEGKVVERFSEKVTRTIDGNKVTWEASQSDPAFLIEQSDGSEVLKSESELERV